VENWKSDYSVCHFKAPSLELSFYREGYPEARRSLRAGLLGIVESLPRFFHGLTTSHKDRSLKG
jgi:hypothetical protein